MTGLDILVTKRRMKNKKKHQSEEGEWRARSFSTLLRRRISTVILMIKCHCFGFNLILMISSSTIHGIHCLMEFYSHCFSRFKAIKPSRWLRIALNQL